MASEQHQQLLKKQDETLDTLGAGVSRVKALAGVMAEELSEQAVILDKLEDDVDRTDTEMGSLNKKLRSLVEQAKGSDRALYSIIGCLVVLLIVLLVLILD